MDAIEISVRGDILLIANNLSSQEIEAIEEFAYQYFVKEKKDICIDTFVTEIKNVLQIPLERIDIVKVIAI